MKKYDEAAIEIIRLNMTDVIITSGEGEDEGEIG